MKSNPIIESIQANLAHRIDMLNEIAELTDLIASTGSQLKQLEETGDITAKPVIAQIAELQILAALLPRRLAAREQAFNDFDGKLLQEVNECIPRVISPRNRQLSERTTAKLKISLGSIYADPVALDAAIRRSDPMTTLMGTCPSITSPELVGGIVRYAQRVLDAWNNLDAIEAKL